MDASIGRAQRYGYWRVYGNLYRSCTEQQLLNSSRLPVYVVHRAVIEEFKVVDSATLIAWFTDASMGRAQRYTYWRVYGNLYKSCTEEQLLKS